MGSDSASGELVSQPISQMFDFAVCATQYLKVLNPATTFNLEAGSAVVRKLWS